jgi:hypothetical protein
MCCSLCWQRKYCDEFRKASGVRQYQEEVAIVTRQPMGPSRRYQRLKSVGCSHISSLHRAGLLLTFLLSGCRNTYDTTFDRFLGLVGVEGFNHRALLANPIFIPSHHRFFDFYMRKILKEDLSRTCTSKGGQAAPVVLNIGPENTCGLCAGRKTIPQSGREAHHYYVPSN